MVLKITEDSTGILHRDLSFLAMLFSSATEHLATEIFQDLVVHAICDLKY